MTDTLQNAKVHANLDDVTRDLVVLIKEDWNPNKPEHSEEDEDEDSIEVDIAPKLALKAIKFFKSVYSTPELCAVGMCTDQSVHSYDLT